MAERETREEAQERILTMQAAVMARLESNPKFQSLDFLTQDQVARALVPQLYDPTYEIAKLLKNIQIGKTLIGACNALVEKMPELSDICSEVIQLEQAFIRYNVEDIKTIKRGNFEWVTK